MAEALRELGAERGGRGRTDLLRHAPLATLLLFLAPLAAGLIGTLAPAFGYLPALGGSRISLDPWRMLFNEPALGKAICLTLASGLGSSILAVSIAIGLFAAFDGWPIMRAIRRLLAPLLAVPHAALAIGLAFLIAPSGWLARLVSPWPSGWTSPPALPFPQDPWGISLLLGLVLKETPFLILMIFAAYSQSGARQRLANARSLGYGPVAAWIKTVLPAIYPQIRLPIFAVLAYSLTVVDMAIILGPTAPPTLAVLLLRWFNDPDLSMRFAASAGAVVQLLIVIGALGTWRLGEAGADLLGRRWLAAGGRGGTGSISRALMGAFLAVLFFLSALAVIALALWSLSGPWRFPALLPQNIALDTWQAQSASLSWSFANTLCLAAGSAVIALILVIACLENEQRHGLRPSTRALWLLYAPLLVPQVSFLFGTQILAVKLGLDSTWIGVVWSHLLFVLPYVFLSLSDSYRSLDDRYLRSALCLGAGPNRFFWRVRLPMLLRPLLIAFAIGFAVSVTQYLPTLFVGGGRFATLTTEAVSLSAGADRRVVGVYALLQALLPLSLFALALALPSWLFRHRRALRTGA